MHETMLVTSQMVALKTSPVAGWMAPAAFLSMMKKTLGTPVLATPRGDGLTTANEAAPFLSERAPALRVTSKGVAPTTRCTMMQNVSKRHEPQVRAPGMYEN